MTPKEKAQELVGVFIQSLYECHQPDKSHAKQCALICVEEIMKDKHACGCEQSVVIDGKYQTYITYWQQVKTEIESL